MTTRRAFLRLAGTTAVVVAASAAGLSQLDQMPDAAIEAWRGPKPDVRDPRLRALSFALLAPNPHNMQSWIADLREPSVVTFYCDASRLLPETDPFSRQIVVGCGCFLETLRIAAAELGFRVEQQLFPAGAWPENGVGPAPLARLVFVNDANVQRDPLFAQILRRRSVKVNYRAQQVARPEHVAAVGAALNSPTVSFAATSAPSEVARLKAIATAAYRAESHTHRTHMETVQRMRFGADEILQHRDGLAIHGPAIWAMKKIGVLTPETLAEQGSSAFQQTVDVYTGWIENTWSFAWMTTASNDRAAQLSAGAAYVRANLKATEMGLAMAPLSQALQEFPEMSAHMQAIVGATRTAPGHTLQMFFRMGYADPVLPAPRRPLDAIIRA